MSKSKTEIKGFPRPPKNSGLFPKNPKKVTITLDEVQAKLLSKFLDDLVDSRSDCGCNDAYEDEVEFVKDAGYHPHWLESAWSETVRPADLVKAIKALDAGEAEDETFEEWCEGFLYGPSDTTFISWVRADIDAQLQAQGVDLGFSEDE